MLSDPHKRAIYDCLGKKGLKEQGWEIVQRTKTPSEIREEYERLAKLVNIFVTFDTFVLSFLLIQGKNRTKIATAHEPYITAASDDKRH